MSTLAARIMEEIDGVMPPICFAHIATLGKATLLRLYSPLEPFFTKEWRPSEIELVK